MDDNEEPLADNYRPTQALNGRTVYHSLVPNTLTCPETTPGSTLMVFPTDGFTGPETGVDQGCHSNFNAVLSLTALL